MIVLLFISFFMLLRLYRQLLLVLKDELEAPYLVYDQPTERRTDKAIIEVFL